METKFRDKKSEKKKRKKLLKTKKSRIIVRNVSFKANEDIIREYFSKFGKIIEINVPKNSEGKMIGFCFVGFDAIKSALKAIKQMNGTELLGRTIAVDFALAKKRFQSQTNSTEDYDKKQEFDDNEKTQKPEDNEDSESDENEDQEEDNESKNSDIDESVDNDIQETKPIDPKILNDASEERTVFVRNLSFFTSNENLNEFMTRFGPTEYTKVCVDPYTEQSKGTAFVKFKNKSDANKCLEEFEKQENDFFLEGRQMNISLAVTRTKLKSIEEKRLTKDKDKRNLYLAKEGLIYPDSPAAEGVSQSDLAKRLALETRKRKALQNTHFFISKTRLCIHNLPENYDKQMLKKLFLKAVDDKKAQIIEARVMFDIRKSDSGFGKSKGFGFVEFKEHIHALKALRHLNNNPNIFSPQKRPIVEFSIENKVALNKKKHRIEKNLKMISENNEELPEESNEFSGVMSRPDKPNHKVKAPKVNKKLGEMKKQLKIRRKEIKKNKSKKTNEMRHKIKVEKRKQNKTNKKNNKEIEDSHDLHYKKRKNIFQSIDETKSKKRMKKVKWFTE